MPPQPFNEMDLEEYKFENSHRIRDVDLEDQRFDFSDRSPSLSPSPVKNTQQYANDASISSYLSSAEVRAMIRQAGVETPNRSIRGRRRIGDYEEKEDYKAREHSPSSEMELADEHEEKPSSDLLDFIFGRSATKGLHESGKHLNGNSMTDGIGSDSSSPIKLHPMATPQSPDSPDYILRNEKSRLRREPNSPLSITPSTPSGQEDDDEFLESAIHFSRSHSLLDAADAEDTHTIDELRKKKRKIEEKLRSRTSEPEILIPRGYKEKGAPSNYPMSRSKSVSMEERDKFQKFVFGSFIFLLVVAAMALVVLCFFWPLEGL